MVTAAVLAAACFLWLLWSGMIPNGRTDRETGFSGPVSINMAVSQLNAAYKDRLADLQDGDYHEIQFQGQGPDWHSILAVFACKISQGSEAMELSSLNEDQARPAGAGLLGHGFALPSSGTHRRRELL